MRFLLLFFAVFLVVGCSRVPSNTVVLNNTVVYNNTVSEFSSTTTYESYYYQVARSEQCAGKSVSRMKLWNAGPGMSMLPAIDTTSKLLTVDYDLQKKIVPGDILVVRNRFTHRVVGVYDDYLVTKGDNNRVEDGAVYYSEIEAVVCAVLRT